MSYLFDLIINDLNYKIISDKDHTSPGSKEFWQSLISKEKFEIYRYDVKSNYKRKAINYNEKEIWSIIKPEHDELIKELAKFENLKGLPEFENNLESEYQNELIQSFEIDFNENISPAENIQDLIDSHKRKIESKENIRLIAEKKT